MSKFPEGRLVLACERRAPAALRLALDEGADPNAGADFQRALAVAFGSDECVAMLLEAGADPMPEPASAGPGRDPPPLSAAKRKDAPLARALVGAGARVARVEGEANRKPLFLAALHGDEDMMGILLQSEAAEFLALRGGPLGYGHPLGRRGGPPWRRPLRSGPFGRRRLPHPRGARMRQRAVPGGAPARSLHGRLGFFDLRLRARRGLGDGGRARGDAGHGSRRARGRGAFVARHARAFRKVDAWGILVRAWRGGVRSFAAFVSALTSARGFCAGGSLGRLSQRLRHAVGQGHGLKNAPMGGTAHQSGPGLGESTDVLAGSLVCFFAVSRM